MFFAVLTFISAFVIEGLASVISVIGLSSMFGANPIIIALAISLDLGKIVTVSILYKYWAELGKLMKTYALFAATVTMIITSTGAFSYLTSEFQQSILSTQTGSTKVQILKDQQLKYEDRKKQIDAQIAAIPEKYSPNQRIRLMNQFKVEQKDLTDKIAGIDKELPTLQIKQIETENHAGPVLYIAKAFDVTVETAVKYVILTIIVVFDPLAIFLIIAGNFLLDNRRKLKAVPKEEPSIDTYVLPEMPKEVIRELAPEVPKEPVETKDQFLFRDDGTNFTKPLFVADALQAKDIIESQKEVLPEVPLELVPIEPKKERETITLSSLGAVKPDPNTLVGDEIGLGTGAYTTGRLK